MDGRRQLRRNSGFKPGKTSKQLLGFEPIQVGHSYPQQYPHPEEAAASTGPLGAPLSIREVARVIGCSPWTVRQRYLPAGLPHHRLTPNGKLIFYKTQITRWLLARQQKGVTLS
ncbi:MAG TPA: hypothetical protein VGQ49_13410 [Bryobacteraceae bacterium]|jgi:hypothetical protein|nr:hypothetical protein [Bryobacteraceae bacterium]